MLRGLRYVCLLPALLAPASALAETDRPAADSQPTVKQLPGGAVLHLGPGARIEMGRSMKLQLGSPGSAQTVTQVVKLVSGRLDVDLPLSKTPRTALLIQAPHKVSAVAKGGHSTAIADADRVTFAAVEGDMLAAAGNDWKPLPSGLVRAFVGSDPTPQEHAVPGAPTVAVEKPVILALEGGQGRTGVNAAGGGSPHYQISLWRKGESAEPQQRITVNGASGELSGLAPGSYEVSARALDDSGIFGPDSARRALRVIGAELPPGSRYENGVILLGQTARLKLVGSEGLQATYGASNYFIEAPSSFGLTRGQETVVRLREAGSTDEVRVLMAPRTLHANVHINPRLARWPLDKVDVTVELYDARGQAAPDSAQPKTEVFVDRDQVSPSWTRAGNTLHATIPAGKGAGPWIVRVEVSDEFGDPAGRDFLEVESAEPAKISAR
ncbi:MAG TPA: hypothetical protein VGI10_07135 [Polyangiaceae bacterium]